MIGQLLTALERQRRHERWTRAQLDAFQAQALAELRAVAYARSPFYQQFHAGRFERPLGELPVLTKAQLMAQFDGIVTDRTLHLGDLETYLAQQRPDQRFAERYRVNATSGSTGRRGLFLFDPAEWLQVLASFAHAQDLAGLNFRLTHRFRLAFVASTTAWHMSAQAGTTLRSWWTPALRLDATEPLATLVERLNTWQPEVLVAYASMLGVLANEQRAGRLQIAPRRVFASSEVLTAATQRLCVAVWGTEPYNQYAATETGSIAAECPHHRGMHVFEDQIILENVDAHNQPVTPGTWGTKLLVTVLWSRTLPLIRYELTDSVRLATERCPCGRSLRLIEAVQGRTEDVLQFPSAAGRHVDVHPNVFHRIMDTVPVAGWQIAQEGDVLRVLVSGTQPGFDSDAITAAIQAAIVEQGARVPRVSVERVPAIPKAASGKAPLIRADRRAEHDPAATAANA